MRITTMLRKIYMTNDVRIRGKLNDISSLLYASRRLLEGGD